MIHLLRTDLSLLRTAGTDTERNTMETNTLATWKLPSTLMTIQQNHSQSMCVKN